jgi:hypothetical protein
MLRKLMVLSALSASLMFAQKPEKGFKSLFNGKDFTDWSVPENKDTFTIKDGALIAKGPRSHAFYVGKFKNHEFKNFELKVDVMTEPNSNGGIYFHTAEQPTGWPAKGFEVQVNNTHTDWRKTGGLYAVEDNKGPVAQDGKWFTEHIVVKDKTVTIFVDGKQVTTWTQPDNWVPPKGMEGRMIGAGTIALQGHDPKSVVYYKNIRIKPLK